MMVFDEGAFDAEEDEEEVFDDDEFLVLDPRSSTPVLWVRKGVVFRGAKFQDFFQLFFLLLWLVFGASFLVVVIVGGGGGSWGRVVQSQLVEELARLLAIHRVRRPLLLLLFRFRARPFP